MNPHWEFEERDGYLYFHVSGHDSLPKAVKYWTILSEKCKEFGCKKVLFIEDCENQLSALEIYELCVLLPDLLKGLKVAFLDRVSGMDAENKFGENVAVNRGVNGQIFNNEADAVSWLQG